jgi:transposase
VRQFGNSATVHGRISMTGRAHVRGVLVEAAWSASRAPGPLRAFYQRVKGRRGFQKAVVALAVTVLASPQPEDVAGALTGHRERHRSAG